MAAKGFPLQQRISLWKIIDWIFPPACAGCGVRGESLCPGCHERLLPLRDTVCPKCGKPLDPLDGCLTCKTEKMFFSAARAAYLYEGVLRTAIHQLKYEGNLGLAEMFAKDLFSVYLTQGWRVDFVTAVPLSKQKLNERGFNQSEWIAKPMARQLGVPFIRRALQKIQDTEEQVGLTRHQRKVNLKNAFIAPAVQVKGKTVLLVDDVMTTGSTFNECAKTMFYAGAAAVYCLSVATTNSLYERDN